MSVDVEAAYREHARYVRDWLFSRTRNMAEAEDLASAVWERFASHAGRIVDVNVRGYLTVACRNLVTDRARRAAIVQIEPLPSQGCTDQTEPDDRLPAVADAGSERHLDQFEAGRAVSLLGWLLPRQRAVLEARFLDGLTVAETGARLGMSGPTVKSLTYRGTRELRERLEATA